MAWKFYHFEVHIFLTISLLIINLKTWEKLISRNFYSQESSFNKQSILGKPTINQCDIIVILNKQIINATQPHENLVRRDNWRSVYSRNTEIRLGSKTQNLDYANSVELNLSTSKK